MKPHGMPGMQQAIETPRCKFYQAVNQRDSVKQLDAQIYTPRRHGRTGPREHPSVGVLSSFVGKPILDPPEFYDCAGKPTWIQTPQSKAMVTSAKLPVRFQGKRIIQQFQINPIEDTRDHDLRFETNRNDGAAGAPCGLENPKGKRCFYDI